MNALRFFRSCRTPLGRAALLVLLFVGSGSARAQDPTGKDARVEMRDGIGLATSVYLPAGDGPWPVLVTRTPYDKSRYGRRASRYTDAGYAFVVQDCRGRFASEGEYEPYQTDLEDGYDTIVWVGEQPFCNGRIGITGRSAMGITANLAAAADPPKLVAAYVVTAPESLFDESYFMGGVFREHFRGNFMRLQGVGDQIPLMKARVVLDEQWRRTDLVFHRQRSNVPIYQVGGWFDMFAKGATRNFTALQTEGRPGARGRQKLWMGPWAHSKLDGELRFPDARGLEGAFDEELRWFDHWLMGKDNGIAEEPAVTYYHLASARPGFEHGRGGLRTADAWPPACADAAACRQLRLYLQPGGGLGAAPAPAGTPPTRYRFDPERPVPTAGGANYDNFPDRFPIEVGPVDQRAIGARQDYLRFATPPLDEDLTIQGRIEVELHAATDGPDTDFMVKLVDVYPDGYEALLLDTALRTRYRGGREPGQVKMMTPGEPVLLELDLWDLSITFERGHRIALHVTSSNFPRFEVNPNTGEAAGQSTLPPRVATNSVYHDAERASALVLPVAPYPERR